MSKAQAKCRECQNLVPFEEYHDFPRKDGTVLCVTCERKKNAARWEKPIADSPLESIFWKAAQDIIPHLVFHYKIGHITVDFAIPEKKVAIELDGKQHNKQEHIDRRRDRHLMSQGWIVIRFDGKEAYTLEKAQECAKQVNTIIERASNNTNLTSALEARIYLLEIEIREAANLLLSAIKQAESPFLYEVDISKIEDWLKRTKSN